MDTEAVARSLIEAFSAADLQRMRELLADDMRAYVTNAEGGVDEVVGAAEYLGRIEAMDLASARFSVSITQMVKALPAESDAFWGAD
jgi:hypothetical protein